MSIESLIKETLQDVQGCYIAPGIPEKKLNNAIKSIASGVNPDYVVAVCDITLLGSAKDGCVFLGDSVYCKGAFEKSIAIRYEDIVEAKYEESRSVKDNGKEEIKKNIYVTLNPDKKVNIIGAIPASHAELFVDLINQLVSSGKQGAEFNTTNQCLPLQAMSTEIKMAYIKLVCNFAFSNDGKIDAKEYAEIISLLVRTQMQESQSRLLIREYMNSGEMTESDETLIDFLKQEVPSGSWDIVPKSLMKDILYIYKLENNIEDWQSNGTILNLQGKLGISDDQIGILVKSIKTDEDILEQRKSDTEIEKSVKEMAAGAAAVGVPIAAIYFSGSVVGMSAAGMTSGLAALGISGGFLGLSSMATGLGVVALMGVASYKGIKKVTGMSEIENNRQREMMLQEVIKNSQQTLNYLIEDVNLISQQLVTMLTEKRQDEAKIRKMAGLLTKVSKGATVASKKIGYAEKETIIAKIPRNLSITRLNEMTNSATRQKYREFVLECYKEQTVENETGESKIIYQLDYDLDAEKLDKLHEILDNIGYLSLKESSVASAKGFMKKAAKNIFEQ